MKRRWPIRSTCAQSNCMWSLLWAERKVDQGVVLYVIVMTRGRGWAVAAAADWMKKCRSDGDAAAEWRPVILFQVTKTLHSLNHQSTPNLSHFPHKNWKHIGDFVLCDVYDIYDDGT